MKVNMKVEGLKELDQALAQFKKSTGRNVLRRALVKAAEPIVSEAQRLAPFDTGELRNSITASSKISNNVGKAEYAQAMKAGLGKAAAGDALREARSGNTGGSFAEVFVGPAELPYAHFAEFGTVSQAPRPFLRPAFDTQKGNAVAKIRDEIASEIATTAARVAKRALKGK